MAERCEPNLDCPATINTRNNIPNKFTVNHKHPSDRMQIKVNDVLQNMKIQSSPAQFKLAMKKSW